MKALRGYGRKRTQQAGPGGFSTSSGAGKDSWPGLCSTGCLTSHQGGFRRWQQSLKAVRASQSFHLKREKKYINRTVCSTLDGNHPCWESLQKCKWLSEVFKFISSMHFFPTYFFQLCNHGDTLRTARSPPVTSPAWWQFKMISW